MTDYMLKVEPKQENSKLDQSSEVDFLDYHAPFGSSQWQEGLINVLHTYIRYFVVE